MDTPPQLSPALRPQPTTWILVALLALVIAALFGNLRNAGFIDYDDDVYVTANPHVKGGLTADNIAWAWTQKSHAGYWIPLTWMSLQLDATLSGNAPPPPIDAPTRTRGAPPPLPSAAIYHVHNILLHIVAAILLFLFLYRITKLRTAAWIITLLWAIHPLRVESVAWVTERKDVLAAMFGFLAMLLYAVWLQRRQWYWHAGIALAFACSLMCKASFITLPFILVLVDAWPLMRITSAKDVARRLGEKWLLLLIMIAGAIAMLVAQHSSGAVRSIGDLPLSVRLQNALASYAIYLIDQVRVWQLAALYPYNTPPGAIIVTACALLLAAITALCLWQTRRRPWLLIGWLWFVGAMFPWIGLIQSGPQAYADRLTYLPSIGLFIMVIFAARELWQKTSVARIPLAILTALAAIYFAAFTLIQISYWQDTVALAEHALAITDKNIIMHGDLAIAYLRLGENQKAEQHYKAAVELAPNFPPGWLSLGTLHLELGQYELAFREIGTAARLDPRNPKAHYFHGVALEKAGHPDGAVLEYQNTLNLAPDYPGAREALDRAKTLDAQRRAPQPAAPQIGPLISP